eukprot:356902-Chlamydomonas_euryale.AAC.6
MLQIKACTSSNSPLLPNAAGAVSSAAASPVGQLPFPLRPALTARRRSCACATAARCGRTPDTSCRRTTLLSADVPQGRSRACERGQQLPATIARARGNASSEKRLDSAAVIVRSGCALKLACACQLGSGQIAAEGCPCVRQLPRRPARLCGLKDS